MKNIKLGIPRLAGLLSIFLLGFFGKNQAQVYDPRCFQTPGNQDGIHPVTAFFNYGNSTKMKSNTRRMKLTIGQHIAGSASDDNYLNHFGFWGSLIVPPLPPVVSASQGELLDRIQITWQIDPLGAFPVGGFNLYRDGVFLANVPKNIRSYNDFNVIAGKMYNYEVRGVNIYGEGASGKALGFQVPNGVVTGWVRTAAGNPVVDALVSLDPLQGTCIRMLEGGTAQATASPATSNHFLPTHAAIDWTVSFWVKPGLPDEYKSGSNNSWDAVKLISFGTNLEVYLTFDRGIRVQRGTTELSGDFNSPTPFGWQHVALAFDGGAYRLFLNGKLVDVQFGNAILTSADLKIGFNDGFLTGPNLFMDDLRIYHRRLDEFELSQAMEGTASTLTPDLKYYWKMDEGIGTKTFDLIRLTPLYFCRMDFVADRAPVRTSGLTNDDGYYRIESANYGTGTTFLATPSKNFYDRHALKLNRSEGNYAQLPNFPMPKKATLEMWVNESSAASGNQYLLYKKWDNEQSFGVQVQSGTVYLQVLRNFNGSPLHSFGTLGFGYHHLAFTIDQQPTYTRVQMFRDGVLAGTKDFTSLTGDWTETGGKWQVGALGAYGNNNSTNFDGLVDEIAVYDTIWDASTILGHAQNVRDPQEKRLKIYFPFDEGAGGKLNNVGSHILTETGTTHGAGWSVFAPFQSTKPHEFSPKTRQVTLNPSVTSVDQVDFTDRSTVAVSGFVRYAGTDCFAKNIEILVNGESFKPRILTDSTGKFSVDFDPGTTATLTPVFNDHVFVPAFLDVVKVSAPIAGLVFNDITTRKIEGQVVGGECKRSIILNPGTPSGTVCRVRVRAVNGCFERQIEIDNEDGDYEFENLPPMEMTVAVVEHSDPLIKTAFQIQGGSQLDMSEKKDTVLDFTYFAPPQVTVVSGFDPFSPTCNEVVLEQHDLVTIAVQVQENYPDGGACLVDTAKIKIVNGFGDIVVDTTMSKGLLTYKFRVGKPIPTAPFKKTFQLVATTLKGLESSYGLQGIILGTHVKHNTFTTLMPMVPSLVLHDPPGDGSFSYFEKGQTICQNVKMVLEGEIGGGIGINVDIGPENTVVAAPGGVGELIDRESIAEVDAFAQFTFKKVNDNSLQTCASFSERISTTDADLVVGDHGGDVYVGIASNLEFGFADVVDFDTANCAGEVKTVLNVAPTTFETRFMYGEWGIKNYITRYLDSLMLDPNATPAQLANYTASKAQWLNMITENDKRKANNSIYTQNLSFDAGASYEYTMTADTVTADQDSEFFNSEGEVVTSAGFELFDVGATGRVSVLYSTSKGKTTGTEAQTAISTGYVLKDDDIGDAFSVDVGLDPMYKTPIFRTKSGQSSCPWEYKTAHREGNTMQFRDGSLPVQLDVPPDQPATYLLTLGNKSETEETMTYALTAGPESNPHGAKIKVNGSSLDFPLFYAVPWGTVLPITVTLERGPIEYDYDSLEIVFYSLCEDMRANTLGILPDADTTLYSAQYLSAHFIRPCSEVNIHVPEQNWVVFPDPLTSSSDDVMRITVTGYDRQNMDFEKIRVQYRRSDGDGAWINIVPPNDPLILQNQPGADILRDSLGVAFTQFYWDTYGLNDGNYEIRAIAICAGNPEKQQPGYSQIIKGRIQRQPPQLIGTPQPSDGVFHVGDEISFEFNKDVRCDALNTLSHVNLFDATTDQPIGIEMTCKDNKIILVPSLGFNNEYFENRILRAELHNIPDLTGNKLIFEKWEFYVDRNELAWLTDSLGMTKNADETKTVEAKIHNRGGYPVPFEIQNVPAWVRVVPNEGTLAANEIRAIRFEVDSTLPIGWWSDSIVLKTLTGQNPFFMGGSEGLPFGVRVICRPPNWEFDPQAFTNSMNMVLKLDIGGQFSSDPEDMVVAFIGTQIVGRAHLQFVPQTNSHLVFLTIYGEAVQNLAPVRLEIWDASACLRYQIAETNFTFQPDVVVGNPTAPQVIHSTSNVLRAIPFGKGWNWVSFNLTFPDANLNPALASLVRPANDLIKSQTQFSTYSGSSWVGSLANLDNKKLYQFKADLSDTLQMLGTLIDPATNPINLTSGWNWIGYLPQYPLEINTALGSLTPTAGDLIKSQTEFAQFINPTNGWLGNLKYLQAPQGYQIKLATAGVLTYPPQPQNRTLDAGLWIADGRGDKLVLPKFWTVDASKFEHSSTLIGMLKMDGANATTPTMELGAFVGAEIRGASQAVFIEPLDAYLFFLTTYSNTSGEELKFKIYDSTTGLIQDLAEKMEFAENQHQGGLDAPVPFSLKTSAAGELDFEQAFEVQPNPFRTETLFKFSLPENQEVVLSVVNLSGQTISEERFLAASGLNTRLWRAENGLESGVYFVRLETSDGTFIRKMIFSR